MCALIPCSCLCYSESGWSHHHPCCDCSILHPIFILHITCHTTAATGYLTAYHSSNSSYTAGYPPHDPIRPTLTTPWLVTKLLYHWPQTKKQKSKWCKAIPSKTILGAAGADTLKNYCLCKHGPILNSLNHIRGVINIYTN